MKRALITLWLLLTLALSVHAFMDRQVIIVVHTGESKTLHWNPATHELIQSEMADGNAMTTVQPKESSER